MAEIITALIGYHGKLLLIGVGVIFGGVCLVIFMKWIMTRHRNKRMGREEQQAWKEKCREAQRKRG